MLSFGIVTVGLGLRGFAHLRGQEDVEIGPLRLSVERACRRRQEARPMVSSCAMIGQDSLGRSAGSRCPGLRQQAPISCKVLRTISAIVRMVLAIVPKNSATFAAHKAMMRSSA